MLSLFHCCGSSVCLFIWVINKVGSPVLSRLNSLFSHIECGPHLSTRDTCGATHSRTHKQNADKQGISRIHMTEKKCKYINTRLCSFLLYYIWNYSNHTARVLFAAKGRGRQNISPAEIALGSYSQRLFFYRQHLSSSYCHTTLASCCDNRVQSLSALCSPTALYTFHNVSLSYIFFFLEQVLASKLVCKQI